MDKLTLTNKKEGTMALPLNLIIEQKLRGKITDLTKRVYRLVNIHAANLLHQKLDRAFHFTASAFDFRSDI